MLLNSLIEFSLEIFFFSTKPMPYISLFSNIISLKINDKMKSNMKYLHWKLQDDIMSENLQMLNQIVIIFVLHNTCHNTADDY